MAEECETSKAFLLQLLSNHDSLSIHSTSQSNYAINYDGEALSIYTK